MPHIVAGNLGTVAPLWEQFVEGGMVHPEIKRRQSETQTVAWGASASMAEVNYWKFVDDAIRSTGGFLDGSYIFPHAREVSRSTSTLKKKAYARLEMADYDNFAGVIAEAPWLYIVQSADMIKRNPQDIPGLDEFWGDVDGNGTAMLDFLEYPFMQARAYGTAFVRVDRPSVNLRNEAENQGTPVTLRALPTSAFRWWTMDGTGNLTGLVYCLNRDGYEEPAVYVWGPKEFRVLVPQSPTGKNYIVESEGANPLAEEGRLPFARLHDTRPNHGECLGQSIMLAVAKIARQVYNTDSEIVELRRNTAFPFLALPMKIADPLVVSKLQIGTASAVPFDGDGGEPRWVAPELEAIVRLLEYREKKKEQAFSMAHMSAVVGHIQTSSGFHAEVEMDKTQRRIGRAAASVESFETEVLDLWAAFRGVELSDPEPTVEYPREFGIRDMDKVYARTQARLTMGLGEADTIETLRDFYQALYPRRPKEEIEGLAKSSAQAKQESHERAEEAEMSNRDRARDLIKRKRNDAGNSARSKPANREG